MAQLEVEKAARTFSACRGIDAENVPAAYFWAFYSPHSLQQTTTICRASYACFFRIIP
jgi:hypothetical protein